MKKLYFYLVKKDVVSRPLLVISFLGGYLLATLLFYFYGHALRASMSGLLH